MSVLNTPQFESGLRQGRSVGNLFCRNNSHSNKCMAHNQLFMCQDANSNLPVMLKKTLISMKCTTKRTDCGRNMQLVVV